MKWAPCRRQGFGVAELRPIAFGAYAEMIALAEDRYQALKRSWRPDGTEMTPRWVRGTNLTLVLAGMLPAAKRRRTA